MPTLAPQKALVISSQQPVSLKCGQIGVLVRNRRESVMRKAFRKMVILDDVGCKHDFGRLGFCPLSPEMVSFVLRGQCSHNLSWLNLQLLREKIESMELT